MIKDETYTDAIAGILRDSQEFAYYLDDLPKADVLLGYVKFRLVTNFRGVDPYFDKLKFLRSSMGELQ